MAPAGGDKCVPGSGIKKQWLDDVGFGGCIRHFGISPTTLRLSNVWVRHSVKLPKHTLDRVVGLSWAERDAPDFSGGEQNILLMFSRDNPVFSVITVVVTSLACCISFRIPLAPTND